VRIIYERRYSARRAGVKRALAYVLLWVLWCGVVLWMVSRRWARGTWIGQEGLLAQVVVDGFVLILIGVPGYHILFRAGRIAVLEMRSNRAWRILITESEFRSEVPDVRIAAPLHLALADIRELRREKHIDQDGDSRIAWKLEDRYGTAHEVHWAAPFSMKEIFQVLRRQLPDTSYREVTIEAVSARRAKQLKS